MPIKLKAKLTNF